MKGEKKKLGKKRIQFYIYKEGNSILLSSEGFGWMKNIWDGNIADHAGGGRRSVVNPGTKSWIQPVEVTQFWRPRSGFGALFRLCKTKQK